MGVDRLATEAMMGHSLTQFGIESVYDYCIAHLDWLRDQYLKALPALTFVAELPPEVSAVNHQARQRLEGLKKELRARDEMIERLEQELEAMRKDLEGWKKIFDQILEATGGLWLIDEEGRFVARKAISLREWDEEARRKKAKQKRKKS